MRVAEPYLHIDVQPFFVSDDSIIPLSCMFDYAFMPFARRLLYCVVVLVISHFPFALFCLSFFPLPLLWQYYLQSCTISLKEGSIFFCFKDEVMNKLHDISYALLINIFVGREKHIKILDWVKPYGPRKYS